MGFVVLMDTLRIPSSKRVSGIMLEWAVIIYMYSPPLSVCLSSFSLCVCLSLCMCECLSLSFSVFLEMCLSICLLSLQICLIGQERRYKPEDESLIEKYREDFISNRCGRKLEIISSSEKDEDKDGHKDNPINEVGKKRILDEEGKHNVEEKGSMLSHQRHGILTVSSSIIHPTCICTSSSESTARSPTISTCSSSTLSTSAITTTSCVSPLSSATPLLPPFMSSNLIASPHTNTKPQGMVWAEHFKPREVYEAVRNCSQIKHEIKDSIVAMVTKVLLKEAEWIEVELPQGEFMNERNVCGSLEKTGCNHTKLWNRGG